MLVLTVMVMVMVMVMVTFLLLLLLLFVLLFPPGVAWAGTSFCCPQWQPSRCCVPMMGARLSSCLGA